MNIKIILIILFSLKTSYSYSEDVPNVKTMIGNITGKLESNINVFKGIPYATPPVGDLRWKKSQPYKKRNTVIEANKFGNVCPQKIFEGYNEEILNNRKMDEDCLTLNIWSPDLTPKKPKAVMVWFLPGSFLTGDGGMDVYNGIFLAQQDVVVVTFNYRLGYLGQFAHPIINKLDPNNAIGNYYLSDQILLLEWVRDNILNFGGDPNNITIFGMSAGGISVNYLMGLPAAKGLFHKAISQSSSVLPYKAQHINKTIGQSKSLEESGLNFSNYFKINDSPKKLLKKIKILNWKKILNYQDINPLQSVGPVIGSYYFPDTLGSIFTNGNQYKLPLMLGATSWEGSLLKGLESVDPLLSRLSVSRKDINYLYGDIDEKSVLNNLYFDIFFGSQRWLAKKHAMANLPTYLYHFNYVLKGEFNSVPGAEHGAETPYIFKTLDKVTKNFSIDNDDYKMSNLISSYWVAFAKSGNPNGVGRPLWPLYTESKDVILDINQDDINFKYNFEKKRMKFFEMHYDSKKL